MATPLQTTRSASSPLGVALAFVGMFVVGSLGVQLLAGLLRDAAPAASACRFRRASRLGGGPSRHPLECPGGALKPARSGITDP